jgi:hypothetical protein
MIGGRYNMEYCPFCDGELDYLPDRNKWYCYRCDKYFMQTPVDEPESIPDAHYKRSKVIAVVFVVIILILGVVSCMYLAVPVSKTRQENDEGDNGGINEDKNDGSLKIISVSYTPQNPQPGDMILVTAITENCARASMEFCSYFASDTGGGGTMEHLGDGVYEDYFNPFEEGTELWFIVIAVDKEGNFQVSDEIIIQIGNVERSDISTLSFNSVYYYPRNPTISDKSIDVSAEITSDSTIEYVHFFYQAISSSSSYGGGGILDDHGNDNIYEDSFSLGEDPVQGTIIFFKFAAQDESGNTAVTVTYDILIS